MRTFLCTACFVLILFSACAGARAEKPGTIAVTGGVRHPTTLRWQPGLTVLSAISSAGGAAWRMPKQVFIIRGSGKITVETKPIKDGTTPDPALEPGDKIHVPE